MALSERSGESVSGDGAGAFRPDVVATLSHLTKVVDERLKLGPLRGESASPCSAAESARPSLPQGTLIALRATLAGQPRVTGADVW